VRVRVRAMVTIGFRVRARVGVGVRAKVRVSRLQPVELGDEIVGDGARRASLPLVVAVVFVEKQQVLVTTLAHL